MANKPSGKPAPATAPKTAGAVAEVSAKSLIVMGGDTPDYIKKDSQRGSENVKAEDLVIPRLEIVQATSPAVKEGDPGYIENARPGMLFNSVTRRLYGKETFIIPVHYTKMWLVWKKRKDSQGRALEGGFLGAFGNPDEANDKMQAEIKAGLNADHVEIIDTPQHLCLLVDAGAGGQGDVAEIMLSMARTKAKVSRQFNSMIKLAGGDRFSRVYRIGTQMEKNPKGDYYNYVVAACGHPAKALYDRAEKLYTAVSSGERRVVADTRDLDGDAATDGANAEM